MVVLGLVVVLGVQVHSDLTQLLEEVRRDQPMGLLLARAGVSREVRGGIISHSDCDHHNHTIILIFVIMKIRM